MRHLPNLITALRLALTPFVARAILAGDRDLAFWLFVAAGLTDGLDGFLARRFGWNSPFGLVFDPIADKALMAASYLTLGWVGAIPAWIVWLVLGRDVLLLVCAGLARWLTRLHTFPPSMIGKLSTVSQIAAVVAVLAGLALAEPLLWLTAALTVASGAHYFWRAARELRT